MKQRFRSISLSPLTRFGTTGENLEKHVVKTAKIAHKVIHWKLTILVTFLLPFVVFTLLTSKTNAIPGIKSFVVLSGSMEPKLPVASLVFTKKQPEYKKGDIIAFKNNEGQTITHRIIDIRDGKFKTQGDANKNPDEKLVSLSQVVGSSVFSVPYVGRVIAFLRSPVGFFYSIVFPGLVFIFLELWGIKEEIEKETEKRVIARLNTSQSTA